MILTLPLISIIGIETFDNDYKTLEDVAYRADLILFVTDANRQMTGK